MCVISGISALHSWSVKSVIRQPETVTTIRRTLLLTGGIRQ